MAPKRRPQRHYTSSASAPVGGLNVRDALNAMPITDAVNLVNWIPQQYGVRCRKGWLRFAENFSNPINTTMCYQPDREEITTTKFFAVTDVGIYDVTNPTDTPTSVFSFAGIPPVDISYMTHMMFANVSGTFLLACSHEGGYFTYDGSTWTQRVAGTNPGEVSGVDPDELCFVTSWKRRLWFCRKGTAEVYYSDVDAITGPMTKFDVGPFMKNGGKVAFIASWTIDAGEGIDDFLVIAGENGDLLIYKGTDPDNASTFALVGIYYVGRLPIGRRGFVSLGGDLLILSARGIQPMSYVTRGGQSLLRASSIDYLEKIQPRIADLVGQYSMLKGWSMMLYPKETLLIITVPIDVTGIYDQYVLYTNTNRWTIFRGIPTNGSMGLYDDQLYSGTVDGEVIEMLSGFYDNVPYDNTENPGDPISGVIQPAYSYFGLPGMNKKFHMVRPTFLAAVRPASVVQMATDFQYVPPVVPTEFATASGAFWDIGRWDVDRWGGDLNTYDEWQGVGGIGYAGSAIINTTTVGETFLPTIDYIYEPGGVL